MIKRVLFISKVLLLTVLLFSTVIIQATPVRDITFARLERRITQLENCIKVNHQQFSLYKNLADLQHELELLRGNVEHNQHVIQKIVQQQKLLEHQLKQINADFANQEKVKITALPSVTASVKNNKDHKIPTFNSDKQAYSCALDLYKKKQYDNAINLFEQLISLYPKSVYVANAHYWLGHSFIHKNNKKQALRHFSIVVCRFPQSVKCVESMLKIANIIQKQGDLKKAIDIYQKIVNQYPMSPEAKIAKTRLLKIS